MTPLIVIIQIVINIFIEADASHYKWDCCSDDFGRHSTLLFHEAVQFTHL